MERRSYFVSSTDKEAHFTDIETALESLKDGNDFIEIILDEGRHELSKALTFNFSNLHIKGTNGKSRLSAGKAISGFHKVTDPAALSRIDSEAGQYIMCCDLEKNGVSDCGTVGLGPVASYWADYPTVDRPDDGPGLELFVNSKPMTIARYPKQGFIKVKKATGETFHQSAIEWDNNRRHVEGKIIPEDTRPLKWTEEKDAIVQGYWAYEWAVQRQKIKSIDKESCEITVEEPYHKFGYADNSHFLGFNILCELTNPGEWYLERETRQLYYYPESQNLDDITVSLHDHCILARKVQNITLEDIVFEESRDTALMFEDCENITILNCTIRNTGGWGAILNNCSDSIIKGCEIYDTAAGGAKVLGGNRETLAPSGLIISKCNIHNIARWYRVYMPAILTCGVGNLITDNILHDLPHFAIGIHGNDHIIEKNEMYNATFESNDAGVIYGGRDWSCYGNIIRYNYLHDCPGFENKGCMGIYLDDAFSNAYIHHNLFERIHYAVFIGGGRDSVVEDNVFQSCDCCVHVDNRLEDWAAYTIEQTLIPRLKEVPYDKEPWLGRYPTLSSVLENSPAKPLGTIIRNNICFSSVWTDAWDAILKSITIENNIQVNSR